MQSVLITGGAGFIGQNLVHAWRAARPDDRLIIVDAMTYAANVRSLEPLIADRSIQFVKGDIRDAALMRRLFDEHKFSRVSPTLPPNRMSTAPSPIPKRSCRPTCSAPSRCSRPRWMHGARPGRSIRPLSPCLDRRGLWLAGNRPIPPFRNPRRTAPIRPTPRARRQATIWCAPIVATYGLPALITNCSNNYGPYQHPEKLIPLMIIHALEGKPLPIYGDGSNVRDWLHVSDHCEALMTVIERGRVGETYNVGGGNERNNRDVVGLICDTIDARLRRRRATRGALSVLSRGVAGVPAAR